MSSFGMVRGRRMRVTRLDGCGNPVLGPDSVIVTKGFISTNLTSNNTTPEAINVLNASGEECIVDEPGPRFKNFSGEIALCGVDPQLIAMMTSQPVVLDADGAPVGFRQNSQVDVSLTGFALEIWTSVPAAVCDDTGEATYGYTLFPFFSGGAIGDFAFANASVDFTITGAVTKNGSAWGVGPFDVTRDESDEPGPLLEEIDPDGDHMHLQLTSVAPPEVTDGASALGVPATGANVTSTTAAVLSPANSYAPADLADAATGFTATPSTAWTTGKYVTFLDGTEAHWDGSAWVAGRA
jgi:hypothetical protein